jgi:O-antigen biosynthesis protein WbqP
MPKFRTMYIDTPDIPTHLIGDTKKYLTPIGSFLRKTSLDEVPQLWSVFLGDMSMVGPRPALFNQYDLITLRTNNQIHKLRPGLTGLAQIKGRDNLSVKDKVKYDLQYKYKKCTLFDIYILLITIQKIFTRKDISH